jgi:hypothetical protein
MYLIQVLLPTHDNEGRAFDRLLFDAVRTELAERFGGVTAFVQSPALGLWKDSERGRIERDRMILIEVMSERLERGWWREYRTGLEQRFRQQQIVARALRIAAL